MKWEDSLVPNRQNRVIFHSACSFWVTGGKLACSSVCQHLWLWNWDFPSFFQPFQPFLHIAKLREQTDFWCICRYLAHGKPFPDPDAAVIETRNILDPVVVNANRAEERNYNRYETGANSQFQSLKRHQRCTLKLIHFPSGRTEVLHAPGCLLWSKTYIWSKRPRLEMIIFFSSWLGSRAEKAELKISQMNKCILEITKGCFLSSYCKYPAITYNLRARRVQACSYACLHLHYKLLQKEPTRNPPFKTRLELP